MVIDLVNVNNVNVMRKYQKKKKLRTGLIYVNNPDSNREYQKIKKKSCKPLFKQGDQVLCFFFLSKNVFCYPFFS